MKIRHCMFSNLFFSALSVVLETGPYMVLNHHLIHLCAKIKKRLTRHDFNSNISLLKGVNNNFNFTKGIL